MIGQNDPAVNDEGMRLPYLAHRRAKQIDMPRQHIVAAALKQIYGEEVGAA